MPVVFSSVAASICFVDLRLFRGPVAGYSEFFGAPLQTRKEVPAKIFMGTLFYEDDLELADLPTQSFSTQLVETQL